MHAQNGDVCPEQVDESVKPGECDATYSWYGEGILHQPDKKNALRWKRNQPAAVDQRPRAESFFVAPQTGQRHSSGKFQTARLWESFLSVPCRIINIAAIHRSTDTFFRIRHTIRLRQLKLVISTLEIKICKFFNSASSEVFPGGVNERRLSGAVSTLSLEIRHPQGVPRPKQLLSPVHHSAHFPVATCRPNEMHIMFLSRGSNLPISPCF